MSRASFSTTRQRLSVIYRPKIVSGYEFMGLGEVRHIGEGNKNIMAFTDHTGTSEASTYELRPNYREQDLPLIHTEDDRMGNAILWANCKYHGFWVQTEQQEFFALFKVVNIRYGSSSYTIPGDRRPTTIWLMPK